MKQYDPGQIPNVGGSLELRPDEQNEPSMKVHVAKTFGVAEVLGVRDESGQNGVIAVHPDGSWWWIRKIEPRDPWSRDPDFWRKDATGG